jgi:LuxR family maltose regulon positive regulatory protein
MGVDRLLIATKFAPPRVGTQFIRRGHLLDFLRDTKRCAFTLVTGSAGFGKTILLAQWRQELMKSGAEVAWLSLNRSDKRLPVFTAYLLSALERLGIPVTDDMMLEAGSAKSIDALVALVVGGAAKLGRELYLIIDDYHSVGDRWAHRLMQELLDHCPENLHVVVASRAMPPLSLGRLRAKRRVAEISFAELPFNLEETRLFFEQNLRTVKLSADELRLIHEVTQGWPATLQLITILLRGRPETRSTLRNLGWKSSDLQAYLAEDVLAHLPAELTDFLEQVSVCRRFNAELAAVVTQNARASSLIQRAEGENLLIYRVDSNDRSPWYRLHPLFGEVLAARLARRTQPTVREINRRASRWFAEHDLLVEAVRHAIPAGDLDFAVEAIERAAPATWSLGHINPMLYLLDRLPQETLFVHPRLFFLGCLSYALIARPDRAERWLAQIRGSGAAMNPATSSGLALADAAVALQRDDTQRVIELLEPQRGALPEVRFLSHVYLAALVAAYGSAGRYADAHRLLDDHPVPPEDRDDDMALVVENSRASALLDEGRVEEAARLGATLLTRAETAHGRRSTSANLCAAILGDAYYELDRVDDAREVLANRAGLLQASSPQVMVRVALCHARLDLLRETPDFVLAFLASQASHYQSMGLDRPVAHMLAEQVKILLLQGERKRAGELMARLDELAMAHREARGFRAEIPMLAALSRARVALKESPEEALRELSLVRGAAERAGRARVLVLTNVLSATALGELGRDDDAAGRLAEALRLGPRSGIVRTFLDEGERAGAVLARLRGDPRLGDAAPYLEDLLARFGAARSRHGKDTFGPAIVATESAGLTPRELEILILISQAMPNKEIALTLDITVETVKWNVKNILAKLGVSSRYDARAWARQRGLVE